MNKTLKLLLIFAINILFAYVAIKVIAINELNYILGAIALSISLALENRL